MTKRIVAACESLELRRFLDGAPVLGPELVFPGDTAPALSVGQQSGAILTPGPNGVSLAIWQDTRSGGNQAIFSGPNLGTMQDIYAARVRADGSVIDVTPIQVAGQSYNQWQPKAAWNGTNWLVSWYTERDTDRYNVDLQAVRVSPAGAVLDAAPFLVAAHGADQFGNDLPPQGPLQVVSDGQDWIVTYTRHTGGINKSWLGTKVLANGSVPNVNGVVFEAGDQNVEQFGLAWSPAGGGQYLHASSDYGDGTIYLNRFDRNLSPIAGSNRTLAGESGYSLKDTVIAGGSNGWALAWVEDGYYAVRAARVDAAGNLTDTTRIDVSDRQAQTFFSLGLDWTGVDYAIAFSQYPEDYSHYDLDIFARRLPQTGPISDVTMVVDESAGYQQKPKVVGSGDGGFKAVYENEVTQGAGVAVKVISAQDSAIGQADVSLAAPSQGAADLASDGINFLNVFSSSTAYGTRLLAQRITPAGVALDSTPIVIDDVSQSVRSYEIVYQGGRYLALYQTGAGQILSRTVTPDGVVGPVATVMSNASGVGFNLDNASVNGDKLLLVGNSLEGTLHTQTRYFRVFDATTLAAISGRVQVGVNFAVNGGDAEPIGPGRWLLTWTRKSTHDSSVMTSMYAVVGDTGVIVKPATSGVGGSSGIVVSAGGAAATEAMLVSTPSSGASSIVGLRIDRDGNPIGSSIPLLARNGLATAVAGAYDGTNYFLTWTDQRNYPYPAQPRDDVFAMRVTTDGAVLDPGGFAVADTSRPEGQADVAVAGGKVVFVYRNFRSESPFASYRLAARGVNVTDSTLPSLLSSPGFAFVPHPQFSLVTNRPMQNIDPSDLRVTDAAGTLLAASALSVQTIPASGNTGWTYRWQIAGAALPDGVYTATLPVGSIVDLAGHSLAAPVSWSFNFIRGDMDNNGQLNNNDIAPFVQGLTDPAGFQAARGFAPTLLGDVNRDGVFNNNDIAAFVAKLTAGRPVVLPPPATAKVLTTTPGGSRQADLILGGGSDVLSRDSGGKVGNSAQR